MAVDLNLNILLATVKIRILNSHVDRTIDVLTRGNLNFTGLRIDHGRNILTVLILSRNLGVLIRVVDDDASALLLISRINRLLTRLVDRGLNAHSQRDDVGVLGLVAITINQNVLHCHIRLLLRSLNSLLRRASDLAVFELQALRKTFDRNRAFLHLKALRQRTEALRLYFLLVRLTNSASLQRRIRDHNLCDDTLLLLLRHSGLLSLLNKLGRICLVRVFIHWLTVFIGDTNVLVHHDLNLTGYGHLSGTRLSWSTRDLAGRLINLQALRQPLGRVLRSCAFRLVVWRLSKQRSDVFSLVVVIPRTQWQWCRNNSGKRVRDLPTIRRLTRCRIHTDHSSRVDSSFLQVFRSLEITRLQGALVIALELAHLILELNLIALRISCVPTDRVVRIRHQASRLRGHLRTCTTLVVRRVILRNIEDWLRRHQRELQAVHIRARHHSARITVVLEHVHRERRILHIPTLNTRVDVHVIRINVTTLTNSKTSKRAVTATAVHLELRRYRAELFF